MKPFNLKNYSIVCNTLNCDDCDVCALAFDSCPFEGDCPLKFGFYFKLCNNE